MVQIIRLRRVARIIALLTLVLVSLGAFVRATGAGLSCPDWPLCFGRTIPPLAEGVLQEVVHRYIASIVGIMTAVFVIQAWSLRRRLPRVWQLAVFSTLLLVVQIVFGGLTVTMKLNPLIVTTHLALGTVFFQLFALVSIQRLPREEAPQSHSPQTAAAYRNLILVVLLLTVAQILLGGFVGSSGAALACPDFPACFGSYLPSADSKPQIVQMSHRLLGVLVLLGAVVALVATRYTNGLPRKRRGHLFGVLFMVTLQICLGIYNVSYQIPVWGTVMHLVVAQFILLALASFYFELNSQFGLFSRIDAPSETEIPKHDLAGPVPVKKQVGNL